VGESAAPAFGGLGPGFSHGAKPKPPPVAVGWRTHRKLAPGSPRLLRSLPMPSNFDEAFAAVQSLAKDFDAQKDFYLSPKYQEAEVRKEFIDKFLIALGWDVNHDRQKNPYEQEVKIERKEHGISQRRADYAFYLAPNFRDVKFYIEAKKPFGDIATPDNYFQTIRYGWNSQTPIAALFDFEQFEIVDCRFKPNLETALQHNLKRFKYTEYADQEKFAEIYWLFSREAVAGGSLEKYAEALPKKRGAMLRGSYQSIDEAFLEELDAHRDALAHIFKNHNPELDGDKLTEATQRTLDRLVFIRFLEDKLIEPQNLVARFGERGGAWGDFIAASRRLDGIYNGIVFKKNDILDSPAFKVDDDQFSEICKKLSHVNSAYDFNTIPIHILGSIYERFLGKVIVATDKRARVEEKPEVRKAGGVYYTPEYIVRYIVENTAGKLIEGKTPAQIAEMRFADIACGSGSFLLGVYDLLIRHHTKFYNENPGKAKKGDVMPREDGLHLSLQKKRDILVNNIFGVDIDNQAVEVAQLSLYLKLLQDETPGSTRQYFLDFEQQALLPTLNKNIVCGNSLIGTDILSGELFEPVAERKLNPMNFEDRFPQIFRRVGRVTPCAPTVGKGLPALPDELRDATPGELDYTVPGVPLHGSFSYKISKKDKTAPPPALPVSEFEGGFDAIIGNPPYIRMEEFKPIKNYLREHYQVHADRADIFFYFIERAIGKLRDKGRLGYIVSNTFTRSRSGETLRTFLNNSFNVETIVEFGDFTPFADAEVYPLILVGNKSNARQKSFDFILQECDPSKIAGKYFNDILPLEPSCLANKSWVFEETSTRNLRARLLNDFPPLSQKYGAVSMGIKSGLNEAFIINDDERSAIIKENPEAKEIIKPYLGGEDLDDWCHKWQNKWMIYIPHGFRISKFPAVRKRLEPFRNALEARATKQNWYELQQPQETFADFFDKPKIVYPDMSRYPKFSLDTRGMYFSNTVYFIASDSLFLLGLLNSSLLWFVIRGLSNALRGGLWRFRLFSGHVEKLPIPKLDLKMPADKARHDKLVSLVEQMLAAKPQLARAQSDKDKDFYGNKCAALDRQIDALVYDLYGLTPDEIKIVEGAAT
jgi:type I restriction-modification system DNA methylase subunit